MPEADINRKIRLICIAGLAALLAFSCNNRKETPSSEYPQSIRLADQYGLAYAPVAAARLQGWFTEELPGVELQWATMGNAAAIREAILAGRLEGGCMGIPPYLIGRDRGMEWIATAAVSRANLGLATRLPNIGNLEDLPEDIRIALPQPGSIQHILLSMAADRSLGDAGFFDENLVTLSHPDGMSALLSGGDIGAHFTSPPFLQRELAAGATLVLEGNEAFGGDFTFIIAVMSSDLIEGYPKAAEGIRTAILRGALWLESHPDEGAALLAEHFRMDEDELLEIFNSAAVDFGGELLGMERFRDFMIAGEYLKNESNLENLIFE